MRRAFAAFVVVTALACGAPAEAPRDVALAYFRCLGADPIRTLALVTPAFHERHGLRVATAADARAAAGDRAATEPAAALSIDRHQLGWLAIQSRPELATLVRGLDVVVEEAREDGDSATVRVRVTPREAPPFEQRFALVRGGATWRIDAIEQRGVAAASATAAFAAWPNEAARRALSGGR